MMDMHALSSTLARVPTAIIMHMSTITNFKGLVVRKPCVRTAEAMLVRNTSFTRVSIYWDSTGWRNLEGEGCTCTTRIRDRGYRRAPFFGTGIADAPVRTSHNPPRPSSPRATNLTSRVIVVTLIY